MQSIGIQERELCIKGEYSGGGGGMVKFMMKKNRFISKAYSHTLEPETLVCLLVLVIGCIASGHRILGTVSYNHTHQ